MPRWMAALADLAILALALAPAAVARQDVISEAAVFYSCGNASCLLAPNVAVEGAPLGADLLGVPTPQACAAACRAAGATCHWFWHCAQPVSAPLQL